MYSNIQHALEGQLLKAILLIHGSVLLSTQQMIVCHQTQSFQHQSESFL